MPRTDLASRIARLDGRSYRAYRDLEGAHAVTGRDGRGEGARADVTLFIDRVQGDPFAAPSRLRLRVPMRRAALPDDLLETACRRIALADFLARSAAEAMRGDTGRRPTGSGGSGRVFVDAGGQEVLERSAVRIDDEFVELRLEAGLPARGRRILAREAEGLLCERIPDAAVAGLCWSEIDTPAARAFVACVENQEQVRARLPELGLQAFVGNGSLLPRESGASDRPLADPTAVRFQSPASLEVRIAVPNPDPRTGERELVGMGVPRGVCLIVGGGYHGKSTLLQALERGVHPHVPGDGREHVVSDPGLVKVRAEDGRRVSEVDIHGFVGSLPGGRDTRAFSSEDASGSTSQAAAIVEAVEAGATGLLLDEDSSAANFMLRDARMQALVARADEPITPFIDRVRELYEQHGVSSILVMGGSGEYFDVADRVIAMRDYAARDLTERARDVAAGHPSERVCERGAALTLDGRRCPEAASFDPSRGRRRLRIDVPERDLVVYGEQRLELRGLDQLLDRSQTRAIAFAIHLASRRHMGPGVAVPELLDALDAILDESGLDSLDPFATRRAPGRHPGNLARPRRFEIAAALSRLRGVRWRPG